MIEGRNIDGLVIGFNDIEKFVKVNDLKEVNDPIYLKGLTPTPNGVLSREIFGVGDDRRHRMAYIDLKYHFMQPVAAIKLKQYDKRLYELLYGMKRYVLTDKGDLVEDFEKGKTGSEYLYEIWDKIKTKDKTTIITKEIERTYRLDKDKLFFTKFLVIPPAFRDVNTSSEDRLSTHEINDMYSKLIGYSQSLEIEDSFGLYKPITMSRIQTTLNEIYNLLIITKLKGRPSKRGHYKKFILGKNVDYTSRLVVTANSLLASSREDMLVKYGEAGIPLSHFCAIFFPFISYRLKMFFDNEFLYSGKYPLRINDELQYVQLDVSYDEIYIQDMINRFIKSPANRFDPIEIPYKSEDGKKFYMYHKGRFFKDNTSLNRRMTWTDLLYVICFDINKVVDVTRYPITSENSQFAARAIPISTVETTKVIIGDKIYYNYPVIGGDPNNVFIESLRISNSYAEALGMDFDGDQLLNKSRFTLEANEEGFRQIDSNANFLSTKGSWLRPLSKEFVLTIYMLTKTPNKLLDINEKAPLYKI
jgi:hypothetical protein